MADVTYIRIEAPYRDLTVGEVVGRHDPRVAGLWRYLLATGCAVEVDGPQAAPEKSKARTKSKGGAA